MASFPLTSNASREKFHTILNEKLIFFPFPQQPLPSFTRVRSFKYKWAQTAGWKSHQESGSHPGQVCRIISTGENVKLLVRCLSNEVPHQAARRFGDVSLAVEKKKKSTAALRFFSICLFETYLYSCILAGAGILMPLTLSNLVFLLILPTALSSENKQTKGTPCLTMYVQAAAVTKTKLQHLLTKNEGGCRRNESQRENQSYKISHPNNVHRTVHIFSACFILRRIYLQLRLPNICV